MTSLIDQHIAKLRLETASIAGEQRRGNFVPAPHYPMFIATADIWSVCHLPSGRELVRGLTKREAFDHAMEIFNGGAAAGLAMSEPLQPQLDALTPDDLARMTPASRAYIEKLRKLLADS